MQHNDLFINVWAAYPFCLVPVFFPNAFWLGLSMVLFALGQFVVHGVVMNWKLRSLYNPGLGTVVFGFLAWYLFEVYFTSMCRCGIGPSPLSAWYFLAEL